MATSPELLDLVGFFEAEPTFISPEGGWSAGVTFASVRGADRVEAMIATDDGMISFRWWRDEVLRADLQMSGVTGWELERNSAKESLLLRFHEPALPFFLLQLKPHVCIFWQTNWA